MKKFIFICIFLSLCGCYHKCSCENNQLTNKQLDLILRQLQSIDQGINDVIKYVDR